MFGNPATPVFRGKPQFFFSRQDILPFAEYSRACRHTIASGKVTHAYFKDAACRKAVAASKVVKPGTYWVRATVAADANHGAATSEAAKFKVKVK